MTTQAWTIEHIEQWLDARTLLLEKEWSEAHQRALHLNVLDLDKRIIASIQPATSMNNNRS